MSIDPSDVPLFLMIKLTADQQRQIADETGQQINAIPYATEASFIRRTFGGLRFRVARGVFPPNQATEQLLHQVIAAVKERRDPLIMEAGTGCGAIALACGAALPRARVFATDISAPALQCARQNRARNRVRNVRFLLGSLLARMPVRLRGQADVVVGNLPYLPPRLTRSAASAFPPDTAIGTDADGLGLPRLLANDARLWLRPGGSLVLQLSGFQWDDFAGELAALGYEAPSLSSTTLDVPVAGHCVWPGKS
jgi:release factor glutamine methyltransferase